MAHKILPKLLLCSLATMISVAAADSDRYQQQQLDRQSQEQALDRQIRSHVQKQENLNLRQRNRLQIREFNRELGRRQLQQQQQRALEEPASKAGRDARMQIFEREQQGKQLDAEIQDRSQP